MSTVMRDFVLLYVNGRRHELRGPQVFQPLSDFLRLELRLPGTKVVCAEGDCGSCTVLLGRPRDGHIVYKPITSCIQYAAQLDGAHIITVEGLKYDGALNPAQEAMVAHHGAQCGFCTPGFVASLCSLFDQTPNPSRHDVTRALVGNLCRCTGYDSILAAAAAVDGTAMRSLAELYPEDELRPALEQAAAESVATTDGARQVFKPATLAEAVQLRLAHPQATVLAGGTDLGVVWNKGKRELGTLLCLGEVPELHRCEAVDGVWSIGAATTLTDVERAAGEHLPDYAAMLERFGSPPIKNAGTLGGNLVNGSPIGDTMPSLFVLGAEVELVGTQGTRRVNINDFYTGYRQTVMRPDELLAAVHVPLPTADERYACYKISKRRDLDISTFAAAMCVRLDGGVIREARVAYGGVAATIVRLPQTEASLVGKPPGDAAWREAGRRARSEIKPISDVRGSAEYRAQLAENILQKLGRAMTQSRTTASNGYHPKSTPENGTHA